MIIDQRAMDLKCCFRIRYGEDFIFCTAASDEVDPFLCPEHQAIVSKPQGFWYRDSREARRKKNATKRRGTKRRLMAEALADGARP